MTQKNDSYRLRALIEDGFYSVVNGCPDRSYFIFEINVGKVRIWDRTTLDFKFKLISVASQNRMDKIQSWVSDPTFSDIDLKK